MDKIFETSLGHWSELGFSIEKKILGHDKIAELLHKKCNNYEIYKEGGVVVHMTKKEYETLLKGEYPSSLKE